jgi:hypothetical protein
MLCSNCHEKIKPVVAVDIDGTLGDYHSHFLHFASLYLGRQIPTVYDGKPSFKQWFIDAALDGDPVGERVWHDIKLAYRQGAQKRSMPIYPYAADLCDNILEAGAELWLTTTRPYLRLDNIDPDTRHWLNRYHIAYDGMLYDDGKYTRLAEIVGKDRVVAAVDDLPEMYDQAVSAFGWRAPILVRTRWNSRAVAKGLPINLEEVWVLVNNRIKEWRSKHETGTCARGN